MDFFVLKMSSTFHVRCIYSNAFQIFLIIKANTLNSDQTGSKGAVGFGSAFLCSIRLPNCSKAVVKGGKGLTLFL